MNRDNPRFDESEHFDDPLYSGAERTPIPWEAMLAYVPVFCIYSWTVQDVVPGVKPHARQGMILFAIELLLVLIRTDFVYRLVWLGLIAIAAFGIWSAYQGMPYRLPLIADFVERFAYKKDKTDEPPID